MSKNTLVSLVIPCYNEQANIKPFYERLVAVLKKLSFDYELLYVNDGSSDDTIGELRKLARQDKSIQVINLSKNFGKEIATTAGIHRARGNCTIIIDADGQHPPKLIPEFIKHWQRGAKVVVGVRASNQKEGIVKRLGSKLFYRMFKRITGLDAVPGSTDFRLIDKSVRIEYSKMTERNRSARGLIDWLGFKREYIYFDADARMSGNATYSLPKLVNLALNSFISLSLKPLYFTFYIGLVVLPLSILLGLFSGVEMLIGDPLHLNITGSAFLLILMLFLVGIVLVSQGIMAMYLSHIHSETQNRPLYIIEE